MIHPNKKFKYFNNKMRVNIIYKIMDINHIIIKNKKMIFNGFPWFINEVYKKMMIKNLQKVLFEIEVFF